MQSCGSARDSGHIGGRWNVDGSRRCYEQSFCASLPRQRAGRRGWLAQHQEGEAPTYRGRGLSRGLWRTSYPPGAQLQPDIGGCGQRDGSNWQLRDPPTPHRGDVYHVRASKNASASFYSQTVPAANQYSVKVASSAREIGSTRFQPLLVSHSEIMEVHFCSAPSARQLNNEGMN